jgi:hypothetical protein
LLSKNVKIEIYRTIISPVVLYGCDIWSLTLTQERRLRVFESRALRRIFECNEDEVRGVGRKLNNEEINNLYYAPHIIQVIKSIRMRWAGNVARIEKLYKGFWWGNLSEREHLEDPGVNGNILGWIFRKGGVGEWAGLIWLRIGTGGGHL